MLRIRLGKTDLQDLDNLCEVHGKSRSEVMRALLRRAIHSAQFDDNLFNPINENEDILQSSELALPIDDLNDDINKT